MKTPILTCAAIWNAISTIPCLKTRLIMNTLWKARTTCLRTSNRQSWAARFRFRSGADSYAWARGREFTFANIETTAARDGWWRLCMGRKNERRLLSLRSSYIERKFLWSAKFHVRFRQTVVECPRQNDTSLNQNLPETK